MATSSSLDFDILILGAGFAGATLAARGVAFHLGERGQRLDGPGLFLQSGHHLTAGTGGAVPHKLVNDLGLPLTKGRVQTQPDMAVPGQKASGPWAIAPPSPMPLTTSSLSLRTSSPPARPVSWPTISSAPGRIIPPDPSIIAPRPAVQYRTPKSGGADPRGAPIRMAGVAPVAGAVSAQDAHAGPQDPGVLRMELANAVPPRYRQPAVHALQGAGPGPCRAARRRSCGPRTVLNKAGGSAVNPFPEPRP